MELIEDQNHKAMSVKDWLITILLTSIPVVGFVMLFVYAFGNDGNLTRQNWAKAYLIFMAIAFVIAMFFFILFWGIIAAAFLGSGRY